MLVESVDLARERELAAQLKIDWVELTKIENERIDVRVRSYDWLIKALSEIFQIDFDSLEMIRQQSEPKSQTDLQIMKYPINREWLGKQVRSIWVNWARSQPNPKPNWLEPWDKLSEEDREVDRRIGEAIAKIVAAGRFQCPDCEGTGVIGGVYNCNHLQPNLCPKCEGNGVKFLSPHCQITAPVNSEYKTFEELANGDVFKFPFCGTVWLKTGCSSCQRIGEEEFCNSIDLQRRQVVPLHLSEWNYGGFVSTDVVNSPKP